MMERRLASLEAQNRRLRKCGIVLLVLVGASILMGQAPPAPAAKVIEAQRFVVKDAQGNQRGEFGIRADGNTWFHMTRGKYEFGILVGETGASLGIKRPGTAFSLRCTKEACEIQFRDSPENAALRLGFSKGRPYVIARDPDGQVRMSLSLRDNGDPWFLLKDKDGNRRASLGLMENDEPRFALTDKDGNVRSETGLWQGLPFLMFRDPNKKVRLALDMGTGSDPSIGLYDDEENKRANLMVRENLPSLVFRDGERAGRMLLGMHKNGAPSIRIYDEKMNEVWAVGRSSKSDD